MKMWTSETPLQREVCLVRRKLKERNVKKSRGKGKAIRWNMCASESQQQEEKVSHQCFIKEVKIYKSISYGT